MLAIDNLMKDEDDLTQKKKTTSNKKLRRPNPINEDDLTIETT